MSVIVVPFAPEHARRLVLQPRQAYAARWLGGIDLEAVAATGRAWTGLDARDGTVLGIAGLARLWPGVAMAWSWLSAIPPSGMVAVHRVVAKALAAAPEHRIEATVDVEADGSPVAAQARWLSLLGFEPEGRRRGWRPDGRDMFAFARVRPAHAALEDWV